MSDLAELALLQLELLKLQSHLVETGKRVLVIFEGRDAAGKGGAIFRFTQNLPAGLRLEPDPSVVGSWVSAT